MTPEEIPAVVIEKTIGDTVYIIENVISEKARETTYEKVKKMILNDTEGYQNKPNIA